MKQLSLQRSLNRKIHLLRQQPFPAKLHRSGWNYAVKSLYEKLHDENANVLLDDFVEATLGWDSNNERTHTEPWIGIVHLPVKMDPPFWLHLSPLMFFRQRNVQEALRTCKGLFTLSESLLKEIMPLVAIYNLKVETLLHPTEFNVPRFRFERFLEDPKVVQIGWWLRNFSSFYLLKTSCRKLIVMGHSPKGKVIHEEYKAQLGKSRNLNEVSSLDYLENDEYDKLLTECVVFLDLMDSSANNTVLECIARGTPLLVNRIPAVEEYVGKDYPAFYHSFEEASEKLANPELLQRASAYLLDSPIRRELTSDHFVESFVESAIYQEL